MFCYEFYSLTSNVVYGDRGSGGHHVDYGYDVLSKIGNLFSYFLNFEINMFGFSFKIMYFLLFSLIVALIKILWDFTTGVM